MSQIGHDDRRHSWSSDPYWPESECCHARCSDAFPEAAQCPLNEARMPSRPNDMYFCAAYGDGNVTDYASVECTAESCCSPTCGSTAAITNLTCPDGQVLYDGRTCDLESGDQERQCSSTERCCTEVFVVGQSAPDGAADDTGYDVSFNHFVDSECTIERGGFNGDSGGPLAGPSAMCAQNTYGGQTPFIWHGFCGEGGSVGSFEVVLGTSDCLALGESVSLELGGQVVSSGNTSECVLENPSCSDGSEDCVYQMFTCTPSQTMPCTQPPHLDGYLRPIERNTSQGNFSVDTACAYGHRGRAVASPCSGRGGNYVLGGCTASPSCAAAGAGTCNAVAAASPRCDAPGAGCGTVPAGLAEAYTLAGSSDESLEGTFHRIHASCNGMPVYEMGGFLLLRQGLQWVVAAAESQVLSRCCPDAGCVGYALLAANEENSAQLHTCPESPDGAGCEGAWREVYGDSWREEPRISVTPA